MSQKALVIEDSDDNYRLISLILNKNGVATMWAVTGQEGIQMAVTKKPDFVILDIQLPDMSGLEVVQAIRSSLADGKLPVIAMTSYAMPGDRDRCLAAGCTGYIEKPIDPMGVMDQINRILSMEDTHNEDPGGR